jgi:hypothetical protein
MALFTYNQQTQISAVYYNPANNGFVRLELVFIRLNNEIADPNEAITGVIEFKGNLHLASAVDNFLGYFNEEEEFHDSYWLIVAKAKLKIEINEETVLSFPEKQISSRTNLLPFRAKSAILNK